MMANLECSSLSISLIHIGRYPVAPKDGILASRRYLLVGHPLFYDSWEGEIKLEKIYRYHKQHRSVIRVMNHCMVSNSAPMYYDVW
jgi:hypothetical protein